MDLKIKNHLKKYWNWYLLAIFIMVSIGLRFYNFPFRYGLGDETVRDAAVSIVGARELQLPLTGPFSSAGPFTFGPWYYYQLILAKLILPTHYASWIYLSIVSVACIFLLYKTGEFFGKGFGVLLAFLGTISGSLILSGTHLTNPNLSNLFAFLSIYLFLKLVKAKRSNWLGFFLGISLGIAINIHYQMMGLLILPLLVLLVKPKYYINFVMVVLGLVVTFIPLLFFDLNNHWFNFRNIFYYYTEGKNLIYVPNRWLFYLRDFWPLYIEEVTGVPPVVGVIGVLFFAIVVGYNLYKRSLSKSFILLLIAFVVNFILLRYYWGERFFGYLNYLRPFVLIFEGYAIYSFYRIIRWRKVKLFYLGVVIMLLLAVNIPKIALLLPKDKFTLHIYNAKNSLVAQYPNKKFSLFICPGPGNTYYSSQSHSLLFLLDKDNLLSREGTPVSFANENCLPQGVRWSKGYTVERSNFKRIRGTDLVDLSYHNTASISAMGWQRHSLKLIYDTTTRWWFNEQP